MCGISGSVSLDSKNVSRSEVKKMQKGLSHRGPDGSGFTSRDNTILAMQRLSVIDIKGGKQPLYNEDKSLAIVGNGEIYNYIELSKTLKSRGHKLNTESDIEVALHALEEWGYVEGTKKLRGMFALAVHDKKEDKLVLIRDRMGEKPLYYSFNENSFFFSSELKSLVKVSQINKSLNYNAINLYLHFYYIPEPLTPFKNIKKLDAGTILQIDTNSLSKKAFTYWQESDIELDYSGYPTHRIRQEFERACELTLRADVPVGISLSGGIDSGSILALTAPKYKDRMKAFCIGYEGAPPSDERKSAKELAKKFNVEFIEKEIGNEEMINSFPEMIFNSDDPIADIASFSIYSVSKLAHDNNIKVLLSGVGGDELFWGYPSSIEAVKKNLKLTSFWYRLNPYKKCIFNNPNPLNVGKPFENILSKEFKEKTKGHFLLKDVENPKSYKEKDIVKHYIHILFKYWLRSNVIVLNDRMSMANSVELRSPFLDYKLVEAALSSEKNIMSFSKEPKYWFKKAMTGILPKQVINRSKQGFTPPVVEWLDLINSNFFDMLTDSYLVKSRIINQENIVKVGKGDFDIPSYSKYQLIVLNLWLNSYLH